MSQQSIIDLLKNKKKYYTGLQISQTLNINYQTVKKCLDKLIKDNSIQSTLEKGQFKFIKVYMIKKNKTFTKIDDKSIITIKEEFDNYKKIYSTTSAEQLLNFLVIREIRKLQEVLENAGRTQHSDKNGEQQSTINAND